MYYFSFFIYLKVINKNIYLSQISSTTKYIHLKWVPWTITVFEPEVTLFRHLEMKQVCGIFGMFARTLQGVATMWHYPCSRSSLFQKNKTKAPWIHVALFVKLTVKGCSRLALHFFTSSHRQKWQRKTTF